MIEVFRKNPLFLRFWFSAISSDLGSRMYSLILLWLVYHWTGSALHVGLVMVATALPAVLIAPFAGTLIDRYNKVVVMFLADSIRTILLFMLAFLYFESLLNMSIIITVTVIISIASAFFTPASMSVLPSLVIKEHITQANATNQTSISASAIAGPLVGVGIIATIGVVNAFLAGGIFFLASTIFLFGIKDNTEKTTISKTSAFNDLKEGWAILKEYPIVYKMLDKIALVNFFYASLMIVTPVISKGNATHIGYMMSSIGAGMFVGAMLLSFGKLNFKIIYKLISSFIIMGLAFIAISFHLHFYFVVIFLFIIGVCLNIFNITIVSTYQSDLDPKVIGRVMSIMVALSFSLIPISYGVMGVLIQYFGYSIVMAISGVIIIMSAFRIYNARIFND